MESNLLKEYKWDIQPASKDKEKGKAKGGMIGVKKTDKNKEDGQVHRRNNREWNTTGQGKLEDYINM